MNILLGIIFLINVCSYIPNFSNTSGTEQQVNPLSMEENQ